MDHTPEQLAYWTGFFDGEGTIRCFRRNDGSNAICFGASVCQCSPKVIKDLHDAFGGYLDVRKRRKGWRTMWSVTMMGKRGERFLKAILPYLVEKREEAELALAVRETMDWHRQRKGRPKTECLPPQMVLFRDKAVEQIRLLKHRDVG